MISPFQLLKISPEATRAEIEHAREDAGFDGRASEDELQKAVDALTSPMPRLREEVAYFWGMSPVEIEKLRRQLKADSDGGLFCQSLEKMPFPAIAKANLAAYACEFAKRENADTLTDAVRLLIDIQKEIDVDSIGELINQARKKSGVAPSAKRGDIEETLKELREKHLEAAGKVLCNVRQPGKLATKIAEQYRHKKKAHGEFAVALLRGPYKSGVQADMEKAEKEIAGAAAALRESPDDEQALRLIEEKLPVWDEYAQPLQLVDEGKGLDDKRSKKICDDLRDVALHINNTANQPEVSLRIAELLASVFKELPGVAKLLVGDKIQLQKIISEKRREQNFRRRIDVLKASVVKVQANHSVEIPNLLAALSALLEDHPKLAGDENLWLMVRSAALSLHNTHHETKSAMTLTVGILSNAQRIGVPSSVIAKLTEDRSTLDGILSEQQARDKAETFMAILGGLLILVAIIYYNLAD
ncbi:MAG: hypothetical protein MPK62_02715 [Alphaproteobacteria bacterium]|nr:hypothetical protein [Alphaproteobacteria bacterium]